MSLIPWRNKSQDSPARTLAPLDLFRTEMDRLFDVFSRDPFAIAASAWSGLGAWAPSLDVSHNETEVVVRAEVPGVSPDDLDVSVSGNTLVVSGEKKDTRESKDEACWQSEARYGAFRREVSLPTEVDAEQVRAEYAHGVLTIHLPKSPAAKAKRIAVQAK